MYGFKFVDRLMVKNADLLICDRKNIFMKNIQSASLILFIYHIAQIVLNYNY